MYQNRQFLDLAPGIPHWVTLEREGGMQVHRVMPKCTAFVGMPSRAGFTVEGTAFFVRLTIQEIDFVYAVTCRHIVRPRGPGDVPKFKDDDKICLRINRKSGPPAIIETFRGEWRDHSNRFVDVSVLACDFAKWEAMFGDLDRAEIPTESMLFTKEKERLWGRLWLGDEVFITGAFVGRVGAKKNIPIVRIANIAALPDEPVEWGSPQHPAYLVETRSLGGTSGSPVFLHLENTGRYVGSPIPEYEPHELPYFLVGMFIGVHGGQYPMDFAPLEGGEKLIPGTDVEFNAGIGVVVPFAHIMEIIDAQEGSRMATVEARWKQSGYHPASAEREEQAPPTTDENPQHKEDFNRLLGEAVKGPKSDEQT